MSPSTKSISTENKFNIHKCSWESNAKWNDVYVQRQSRLQLNYHFGVNLWANSIKKQSSSRQRKYRELRMRVERFFQPNVQGRGKSSRNYFWSLRSIWLSKGLIFLSPFHPRTFSLTHSFIQGFNSSKSNGQSSLLTSTSGNSHDDIDYNERGERQVDMWKLSFSFGLEEKSIVCFFFDCVRVFTHVWWRRWWWWCRYKE